MAGKKATEKKVTIRLTDEQRSQIKAQLGVVPGIVGLDAQSDTTKIDIYLRQVEERASIALTIRND